MDLSGPTVAHDSAARLGYIPNAPELEMRMDETEIRKRIDSLREEHRNLDDAIDLMASNLATDQLKLRRLKKRKLKLKDQVTWWESQLIPDLDA